MPSPANHLIIYYACGGGLGHVTRGTAILRQVRRLGHGHVLAVTNAVNCLPLAHEGLPHLHLHARQPDEFAAEVRDALKPLDPALLVVDAFPAGVVGELAELLPEFPCPRVLVCRHLKSGTTPAPEVLRPLFARVVAVEPPAPDWAEPALAVGPVLIRDADELLPRDEARRRLGVPGTAPVVLGVSSDEPEWTASFFGLLAKALARSCPEAVLRLASPYLSTGADPHGVDHYPLLELMPGVDVVVGPAGYNLYHEAQACGVPAIFLPRERRYDDQHWRARDSRVADSPEALERLLAATVSEAPPEGRPGATYTNGARQAAEVIVELLGGGGG